MKTLLLVLTIITSLILMTVEMIKEYEEKQIEKARRIALAKRANKRKLNSCTSGSSRERRHNTVIIDCTDRLNIDIKKDLIPLKGKPIIETPIEMFNAIKQECYNYEVKNSVYTIRVGETQYSIERYNECYRVEDNEEGIEFLCSCIENYNLDLFIKIMDKLSQQADTSDIYEYLNDKYNLTKILFDYVA